MLTAKRASATARGPLVVTRTVCEPTFVAFSIHRNRVLMRNLTLGSASQFSV